MPINCMLCNWTLSEKWDTVKGLRLMALLFHDSTKIGRIVGLLQSMRFCTEFCGTAQFLGSSVRKWTVCHSTVIFLVLTVNYFCLNSSDFDAAFANQLDFFEHLSNMFAIIGSQVSFTPHALELREITLPRPFAAGPITPCMQWLSRNYLFCSMIHVQQP